MRVFCLNRQGFSKDKKSSGNKRSIRRVAPVSYTHLDVYKRQGIKINKPAVAGFLLKPEGF
ncbi:hypothetical protein [Erwinia amylovora]